MSRSEHACSSRHHSACWRLLPTAAEPAKDPWLVFRGDPTETGVRPGRRPARQARRSCGNLPPRTPSTGRRPSPTASSTSAPRTNTFTPSIWRTGEKKWEYKAGPIKASPAYRDGGVYVGDSNGLFHCVDAANGRKRWTFPTGAEITSGANFAGDNILFGSYDETLYCLDKNGKQVWTFKTPARSTARRRWPATAPSWPAATASCTSST